MICFDLLNWPLGDPLTLIILDKMRQTAMVWLEKSVSPRLESCCQLWSPHRMGDISLTEVEQWTFTSHSDAMEQLNNWDKLQHLHLYSLQWHRDRYTIMYVWKTLWDAGIKCQTPGAAASKTWQAVLHHEDWRCILKIEKCHSPQLNQACSQCLPHKKPDSVNT